MSGQRLTRGKRLVGGVGTAAVIAALTGAPSELVKGLFGVQDMGSPAFAGKPSPPPPPPPPPPPAAPQAETLNGDPNIHWFASWDLNIAPGPNDFFATPSNLSGVPFMQTQLSGSA